MPHYLDEVSVIPPGHDAVSSIRVSILAAGRSHILLIKLHAGAWRIVLQPCCGCEPVGLRAACALGIKLAHAVAWIDYQNKYQDCCYNKLQNRDHQFILILATSQLF